MGKYRIILIFSAISALIFFGLGRGHSMSYFFDKGTDLRTEELQDDVEKAPNEEAEMAEEEDFLEGTEDTLFMGDEDEEAEVQIEADSPEYLRAKRELFVEPISRLGAKPLRLTLEDCIRIALVNNNKIQATEYGIDAAEARHMEASARFYPIFEYEWLSAPVPSDVSHALGSFFRGEMAWWNKIRLGMGIPVYDFGKITVARDLAKGGISAAREDRKKEKLSTVTRVRQLYYGVLLAEELGRLLVNAHNKLSKEIKEKEEGGRSPIERIKAHVFLVDLEKRLAETRNKELLALEGLRVQLGLNPDVAVMVYSEKLKPVRTEMMPIEAYLESALTNRPDVKLVEIGLESQRKMYSLEQRKWLPDIGIGAYLELGRTTGKVTGITTTDDYSDPLEFSRAGIGMRVQGKFDVHGQIARVKKAKSDYYKASLDHYMAKDGIGLEVKQSYMDTKTAFDNVMRADKAQKFARQLTFLTQSNYEIGVGEEEEYIEALQLVLLTRGRYFESVFNYNIALAVLEEKSGIIPEVGVQ